MNYSTFDYINVKEHKQVNDEGSNDLTTAYVTLSSNDEDSLIEFLNDLRKMVKSSDSFDEVILMTVFNKEGRIVTMVSNKDEDIEYLS